MNDEGELSPPRAWKRNSLLSLADYHNGAAFNPSHWGEEGLPIIRIEQINDPSAPTDFYEGSLAAQNKVTTGDLIFSWSATLKAVIWRNGDGALNQHLFKVIPKSGTDKTFLKYVLEQNMESISSGSQGSTMKHITRSELQRYQVELPEQEIEQRRIAEILSTLDEAIEQTEALIAKHQQIKAGLMHDLFTRGVTPDGHLRPTREQAPDLYKESPLGWIPKEWGVEPLGDAAHELSPICYGIVQPGAYVFDGIPVVAIFNLNADFSLSHRCATVIEAAYTRSRTREGDVLLSIKGSIGRVDIAPSGFFGNISRDIARIRARNGLNAIYLRYLLESDLVQTSLQRISVGTTRQELSIGPLKKVQVVCPPPIEQAGMVCRLVAVDRHLATETKVLHKLRMNKHGLMRDLLVGRVRVQG